MSAAEKNNQTGASQSAPMPPALAAIDVGTNNCRLLVARPAGSSFRVVDAFSRIVRLGEGVARTSNLSEAAIDRTIEALKVCAQKIERHDVQASRIVATEACRKAENYWHFLNRAQRECGLEVEIISAHEEARLAFAGCIPLIEHWADQVLVFDIGGGSTEIAYAERQTPHGDDYKIIDRMSVPLGVVNLSEKHGQDRLKLEDYQTMVEEFNVQLHAFEAEHNISARVRGERLQMIGASGTVTTLSALNIGLARYNRALVDGTLLTTSAAREIIDDLVGMDRAERAAYGCIGEDRADMVLAGCAILDGMTSLWPVRHVTVGDRGVREGILSDLLAQVNSAGVAAQ
ncbi:MAG: Ppx/GppA phosphatase family protein [Alphaproteobacteria bacterium]